MIRLTLITVAGIFGSMLVFGTEDPDLVVETIEAEVLEEVEVASIEPAPVATPVVEPTVEPTVEIAKIETVIEAPAVAEASVTPAVEVVALSAITEAVVDVTRGEALDLTAVSNPVEAAVVEAITTIAAPEPKPATILVVTGNRVNLREGPSTARNVVGRLQRGDRAELLAQAGDGWMQIRDVASGSVGYMSGDFLTPAEGG